jgi:hypothetical protein
VNQETLVSIVVNNFNYGRFAGEAVESALRQTHSPVEVIVVDDGSTDDSRTVIEEFGERIRSVFKDNGGQASALNLGFSISRGEVVIFLDADDVLLPGAADSAVERLHESGAVQVQWPMVVIDDEGHSTGSHTPAGSLYRGNPGESVVRDGPDRHVFAPTSGNAWARSYLCDVLPMPEPLYRLNADSFLAELAPLHGLIERVDQPLGRYRVHHANALRRTRFEENLDLQCRQYDCIANEIESYCRAQGLKVDRKRWKRNSWCKRVSASVDDIVRLTDADDVVVLADGEDWGAGDSICGRRRRHFPERDGVYWGAPADDNDAIQEVERHREQDSAWMIVAWSVFWWLDHYSRFHRHLDAHYEVALSNDRLIAWNLRKGPA